MIKYCIYTDQDILRKTNGKLARKYYCTCSATQKTLLLTIGYGADVHVRGGDLRETPLHIAARVLEGDRCALMLLKSGAGPNLTTDDGQTPVHVACKYGNTPTLLLLLEDGGDPVFRNSVGETPLHLASR